MSAPRAGRSEAKEPQSADRGVEAVGGTLGCRDCPGWSLERGRSRLRGEPLHPNTVGLGADTNSS